MLVALLVVGVGTAFGVNAYQDAQARSAAEAMVESVIAERELTDAELADFADRLREAQQGHEQLVPLDEMVQARADLFEAESLTGFSEAVSTLGARLEESIEPDA